MALGTNHVPPDFLTVRHTPRSLHHPEKLELTTPSFLRSIFDVYYFTFEMITKNSLPHKIITLRSGVPDLAE